MSENLNQPNRYDAVLGDRHSIPHQGVILGGLDGVKERLNSSLPEHRAACLKDALVYDQPGLYLVMRALYDPSEIVRQAAYSLLQNRPEPRVKRAVEQFYTRLHYSQLRRVLAAGKWQQADQETKLALCNACGLGLRDHLQPEHIADIPCRDLQIIDQLWVLYSQGRFGFSVQQKIWQRYANRYWEKSDVWMAFGDRVGWRLNTLLTHNHWKRYGEITFSLKAPVGHLPFMGDAFGIFTVEAIANRLTLCEL
ncbi:MAG TPA: GUN4 domain-containing protein [Crinalium sp.]